MSTTSDSDKYEKYYHTQAQIAGAIKALTIRDAYCALIIFYLKNIEVYTYEDLLDDAKNEGALEAFYKAEEIFDKRLQ